ncbi:hypothetical protein HanIR_Chr12g0585281 [Helianthus annuus]|nr:hypothetical protein HanIR_Chr12g0585281 [Helianthus annuus]
MNAKSDVKTHLIMQNIVETDHLTNKIIKSGGDCCLYFINPITEHSENIKIWWQLLLVDCLERLCNILPQQTSNIRVIKGAGCTQDA